MPRPLEQTYLWQAGPLNMMCSGSIYQILISAWKNNPWVSGKVLCEGHVHYYPEGGAQLQNRFCRMMDFHEFHG